MKTYKEFLNEDKNISNLVNNYKKKAMKMIIDIKNFERDRIHSSDVMSGLKNTSHLTTIERKKAIDEYIKLDQELLASMDKMKKDIGKLGSLYGELF